MPITHEYFDNTNIVQWLWYYHQNAKDQEESYIKNRNLAEYHASFIEPDLVSEVMKQRDKAQQEDAVIGTTDDAAFNKNLGELFGRNPNLEVNKTTGQETHSAENLLDNIEHYEQQQKELKNKPMYNYKYWTEFDLE